MCRASLSTMAVVTTLVVFTMPASICCAADCEQDDRYDIACFTEGSWPREHSDPVVQLTVVGSSGSEAATGFLCSPGGHIMTNYHAIANQTQADGTSVLFRYQLSDCGSGILQPETTVVGLDFIRGDSTLDYALLKIRPEDDIADKVSEYGYLEFSTTPVTVGQSLYVPQHPLNGGAKVVDVEDVYATNYCPWIYPNFGHQAYTEQGASGSPVLDLSTGRVVGLHHTGACGSPCQQNIATEAVYILPEVDDLIYLPGWVDCIRPLSGSVPTPVFFQWEQALEATSYTVQFDDNSGFLAPMTMSTGATEYALSLPPGTWYWHVAAENSYGRGDWSNTYQFEVVDGTGPAMLSSGHVTPSSGTTSTPFYYYVDYYDPGGEAPASSDAMVGYVGRVAMTRYSGIPSNGTYRCGPIYLDAGQGVYYFEFEDDEGNELRLPPIPDHFFGPVVSGGSSGAPYLADGLVEPTAGSQLTPFYYYVYYYDDEDCSIGPEIGPSTAIVITDEGSYPMAPDDIGSVPCVGTYRSGPVYLSPGSHSYRFFFSDSEGNSTYLPAGSSESGPDVSFHSTSAILVDHTGAGDYLTIQEGVDAASSGDTVIVASGIYSGPMNRGISLHGKNIWLISEQGSDATTIDCEGLATAFVLTSGETRLSIIEGFTVVNGGTTETNGGGIYCSGSSPTVRRCVFDGCLGRMGGGAFVGHASSPLFEECVFVGNTLVDGVNLPGGGGVVIYDAFEYMVSSPAFVDCVFLDNTAAQWHPSAIASWPLDSERSAVFDGCTFVGNSSEAMCLASAGTVTRCIFAFNTAGTGDPLMTLATATHNFVFGNSPSDSLSCDHSDNMFTNPGLCEPDFGDVHLNPESPCLAENNPWGEHIGAWGIGCSAPPWTVDCTGQADFPTIQRGLNAAYAEDTLFVAPGVYSGPENRGLHFGGKNIVLLSTGGPEVTTIDCENEERAFDLWDAEMDSTTVIEGFTVTNGSEEYGGAMWLSSSSPTVRDCVFRGNVADIYGGAICAVASQARFEGCTVVSNQAGSGGGGAYCSGQEQHGPDFIGCTFLANSCFGGYGAAIYAVGGSSTSPVIRNTVVALNGQAVDTIHCSDSDPQITHNCVWGNAAGDSLCGDFSNNLFLDPAFCDAAHGDYSLFSTSPCLPNGNTWGESIGAYGMGCVDLPPAAPTGLAAEASEASIHLAWSPSPEDDLWRYRIERDTVAQFSTGQVVGSVPDTMWTDFPILDEREYYYRITAIDQNLNESEPSAQVWCVALQAPPPAPSALAAETGDGLVNASWASVAAPDLDYYCLERDTTSQFGAGTRQYTTPDTSIVDTDIEHGGTYYYRVLAVDLSGLISAPSDTVSCTAFDTPPAAPVDFEAESGDVLELRWFPNIESDIAGYVVYRDSTAAFESGDSLAFATSASFDDTTGIAFRVYWYCATAMDLAGNESSASDTVGGVRAPGGAVFVDDSNSGMEFGTYDYPYNNIQEGIDATDDERCVVVFPGTYGGGIGLEKDLLLVAMSGASATRILGGVAQVIGVSSVTDSAAIVGFTLDGGGFTPTCLDCSSADLLIEQCVIRNANTGASTHAGSRSTFIRNIFLGNNTALACSDSSRPVLKGNTFIASGFAHLSCSGSPGPVVGGSLEDANDFLDPAFFGVFNSGGTLLQTASNYWGSDCPDSTWFYGLVNYTPWTDSMHVEVYTECYGTGVEGDHLPIAHALGPGFPNPFNPVTQIAYDIPEPGGPVSLRVYSQTGRLVRTLVDEDAQPGRHVAEWDGTNESGTSVASGVYFCRYEAEGFAEQRKLVLLK